MNPTEFKATKEPRHLAEVLWFVVEDYSWYVSERRAVFYAERVLWSDHPWGKNFDHGANFYDEWTIEERRDPSSPWVPTGRSVGGWESLNFSRWREAFDTRKAASLAALARIAESIKSHEATLAELRQAAALLRQDAR